LKNLKIAIFLRNGKKLHFLMLKNHLLYPNLTTRCQKVEKKRGTQLSGRVFSPSDIWKKLSQPLLLHFSFGMGTYVHHAKY
jgi:hypothetical protein